MNRLNYQYAIEMINISKSFHNGKVIANKNINLRVLNNEIHALIGENGAGKSTLMSILFGMYEADEGTIKINGNSVHFSSAQDAAKAGIGMVHQHFKLVDTYSVFENIILGSENTNVLGVINKRDSKKKIQELIDKYNFNLDINKKVYDCSVLEQQKIEILKLLYRDSNILIFDEPTAVLNDVEIESFLQMILEFKNNGKTIIIITHKFNEIKNVADRATVIRRGEYIGEFNVKEKTINEMAELMVGKKVSFITNENNYYDENNIVFEVQDFIIDKKIGNEINFKIHSGEIFAIAGVEGNGQKELIESITGLNNKKIKIILNGKNLTNKSISSKYESGISFVPEDRHKHGLILDMNIGYNSMLSKISKKPYSKFSIINELEIYKNALKIVDNFDVRGADNLEINTRSLSGGNQQKLIIGR